MDSAFWSTVSEAEYNSLKEAVRAQARRFPSNDVLEARPTEVLHEAIVRLAESAAGSPQDPDHYARLVSKQCGWLRSNAWKRVYRWKDFSQTPAETRPAPDPAESAAAPDVSRALASLGPGPEAVVRLKIRGVRAAAIAEAVGLTAAQAAKAQAWALEAMRRKLEPRGGEG